MKIGYVGLGKLGLPVALAVESKGHEVKGVDLDPRVANILETRKLPYMELDADELLAETKIELVGMRDLVEWADIIFVAVQTPHEPGFEGEEPVTYGKDFDYSWLQGALYHLNAEARLQDRKGLVVVVISTCLPGTFTEELKPELTADVQYVYNPYFIAMGTTIRDFFNPEFILLGSEDPIPAIVLDFYDGVVGAHISKVITDPTTAELVKMSYNTFIGQKIVFANTVMEIAEKVGADADTVTRAMGMAWRRLISPAYMRGGMGDGGGCHPRDNIALWALAEQLGLSTNLFRYITEAREAQTEWLVDYFLSKAGDLPLVVLGESYKPQTNLTVGSPAKLFVNLIGRPVWVWDPYTHTPGDKMPVNVPSAFFVATQHEMFANMKFPHGSVVVDPWRYIPDQPGVKIYRVGERPVIR